MSGEYNEKDKKLGCWRYIIKNIKWKHNAEKAFMMPYLHYID